MTHLLAHEPTHIEALNETVDLLEWNVSHPTNTVVLIPGWGQHPRFYGDLIRSCNRRKWRVVSASPRSHSVESDRHYGSLPMVFARVRANYGHDVLVVAESLGATYALASPVLTSSDRAVFIAPGIFLRARYLLSWKSLEETLALVRNGRIPLHGWRLRHVSPNPEYARMVEESKLAPKFSDRRYVFRAVRASLKALVAPKPAGANLIIQGADDTLVSPLGARVLARRLGLQRTSVKVIPDATHAVTWDAHEGGEAVQAVMSFLEGV